VVDVEVIQRGHLDKGLEEVLRESVHLLDLLSACNLTVFVHVSEPPEAGSRVTDDVLGSLQETLACVRDSLRERSDITSSLVALRERERKVNISCNDKGGRPGYSLFVEA
jgi:hypothetical protein